MDVDLGQRHMLPPFIEGGWHVAPAYVDAAHAAQLALILLVCAWRLRAVLQAVPARRQWTVPSRAQLLLQEDVQVVEPQASALSPCALALRGVHALCCCLLVVGSMALLAIDDGNGNPQCRTLLSWCVGLRVAGIGQWLLCLLLVLVEWRAGRRAGRGLRAWWVLSSLVALADALAALAALRQAAATAAATVQLASLVPALLLGVAGLCEGDTPRAPPAPPDAPFAVPSAPWPCTLAEPSPDAPRPSAEAHASAFSRLTLSWVAPLLVRGRRAALEHADLPGLAPADTTHANAARLRVRVAAQRRRVGGGSFRSACVATFGRVWCGLGLRLLVGVCLTYVQPLLLRRIVRHIDGVCHGGLQP